MRQSWEELYAASPAAFAYSIKAWYQQPRPRPGAGEFIPGDHNLPGFYGPEMSVAARVVDAAVADNPALVESRAARPRRATWLITPHGGRMAALDTWQDFTERVGAYTVEAMLDCARLTVEERRVMRLVLDGHQQGEIVLATGKAIGTVAVLRKRAVDKLVKLARSRDIEVAPPHRPRQGGRPRAEVAA